MQCLYVCGILVAYMNANIHKYSRLVFVSIYCAISIAIPSGVVFASDDPSVFTAASNDGIEQDINNEHEQVVSNGSNETVQSTEIPAEVRQPDEAHAEIVSTSASTTALPQVIVVPPPPSLPASPLLVTAYKATNGQLNLVQIYNNSSSMERLNGWRVTYVANGEEYEIQLSEGWILPKTYLVLGWNEELGTADITYSFPSPSGPFESITLEKIGYQPVEVVPPQGYAGQLLHRYKSNAGNYTTNTTFSTGAETVYGGGLYVLPPQPPIMVREILVQPRDCLVTDVSTDCYDYIKVRNLSDQQLDLSSYRLRSGFFNTASTSTNTAYFDTVLAPGETLTLQFDFEGNRISLSANDGTVWFEDRYGFETYVLNVSPYTDSDLTSHRGESWAYDDMMAVWRWGIASPGLVDNRFQVDGGNGATGSLEMLKPCRDDQYRSETTNRCRSISTVDSMRKPCKEGQYRSEETNRCRSIATAAVSVLKPCADDQFRNPASGRCKKIASVDQLADCGEGRERNPDTNRCRNVLGVSMTKADFAPEPVSASHSARIGWLLFGSTVLMATAYGVWEWRREIVAHSKRFWPWR